MEKMPAPRLHGMYGHAVLRAIQHALYEIEFDRYWEAIKKEFRTPDARDANELLSQFVAKQLAKQAKAAVKPARSKRRSAR